MELTDSSMDDLAASRAGQGSEKGVERREDWKRWTYLVSWPTAPLRSTR